MQCWNVVTAVIDALTCDADGRIQRHDGSVGLGFHSWISDTRPESVNLVQRMLADHLLSLRL